MKKHKNNIFNKTYIFIFLALWLLFPYAALAQQKIDINTAGFEKLLDLPGVDEVIAAKIIKYRRETNGFKTIYDILKVPEMTGEIFEQFKDRVLVSGAPASTPPNRPAASTVPQSSAAKPSPAPVTSDGADAGVPLASKISSEAPSGEEEVAESSEEHSFNEGRKASPARQTVSGGLRSARIGGDIKKIEMTPDNYYKVIMGLMRLAKYEKALKNIEDYIKKFPGDSKVDDMNYLYGACLEADEKYQQAIESYDKVYSDQNSELRAIALFRIAVCEDLLNKPREALENYRKYVSTFSDSSCVKDAEKRIEEMVKTK